MHFFLSVWEREFEVDIDDVLFQLWGPSMLAIRMRVEQEIARELRTNTSAYLRDDVMYRASFRHALNGEFKANVWLPG